MAHYEVDLKELLEAGCHFGHQARRWNPKMKKFIYTERDGVHIFDLVITGKSLEEAMDFVRDLVKAGKEVVFVGAKRQAKAIVREEAMKVGAPYVTERWLGGMLTNWEEMDRRIKKLIKLKKQRETGELAAKYTKREQMLFDKEIERLERFFGGIANLTRKPDALFVVDTHRETTAVYEANKTSVKVIGMVDSNADPSMVDYPIPVNDDAVRSIKLVVEKIAQAYADGKTMQAKDPSFAKATDGQAAVQPAKQEAKQFEQKPTAKPAEVKKAVNPAFAPIVANAKPKKVIKPTETKKKATSKKKVIPVKRKK